MAKGAKLKDALDQHKGVDHRLEKQKRMQKKALKRKRTQTDDVENGDQSQEDETELQFHTPKASRDEKTPKSKKQKKVIPAEDEDVSMDGEGSEDWETADEELERSGFDLARLQESDTSDSEAGENDAPVRSLKKQLNGVAKNGEIDGDEDEEEEDEDIPLSDIESLASEDKEDVVPHQRLTINNTAALTRAYKSIALPGSLPFSANQTITSAEAVEIKDIEDDLGRELAFYKQSLEAVTQARALLKKEGVPFSRPADYFAEMVKSDEHMGKIKKKLVDDAASKKASAEARKQRDLKKFGKQVQIAKLQERDKAKRDTLDKIKMLKKSKSTSQTYQIEAMLTNSQSDPGHPSATSRKTACSTWRWKMLPRRRRRTRLRGGRQAQASRTPSVRKRTPNSATAAKNVSTRAMMLSRVQILGRSQSRR